MQQQQLKVIKKDGLKEDYDFGKIKTAVGKSARRACVELDDDDYIGLESHFRKKLRGMEEVSVSKLHDYVESILCKRFPEVGNSYKEYRDFKKNAADALDSLYQQSKDTLYIGDRENANFNSSLTSTKGSLMGGYLRKQIFEDYYMTKAEKEATKDGYIYIHDQNNLFLGCHNCAHENCWLTIRFNGQIKTIQFKDLPEIFDFIEYGVTDTRENDIEVLSKNGFVKLNGVSRRKTTDFETIHTISTEYGTDIRCTGEHIIPIYRNTNYVEVKAKDIKKGDRLILNKKRMAIPDGVKIIPSVPKELEQAAYLDYILPVLRYIAGNYDKSYEEVLIYAGIEELKTVEDYKKVKAVFPIPRHIENQIRVKFYSGASYDFNIVNLADFAVEGGYFLTNGHTRNGCKYPVEILDIYFKNKIPSFVYDGDKDVKYAFLYGCFENFYPVQGSTNPRPNYMWAHPSRELTKDFLSVVNSLGYRNTIIENIRFVDNNNEEQVWQTFKMIRPNEQMNLNNGCIRAYNTAKAISRNIQEFETSVVESHTEKHEKCDVYDLETGDHYFVANGYVWHNCLLFDMGEVLRDGFKMADIEYTEPKSFLSACQVIGDITLSATAAQFGGRHCKATLFQ